MKKYCYLLGVGALLLGGCGKDKEPSLVLAGNFQAASTISAAAIEMYTSAGRIDNPALVDAFLARRKNLAEYFSRVEVPLPAAFSLTLAFRSNDRATYLFKNATTTDSLATEIISRSAQRLVLASLDSIGGISNATPGRTEQLANLIPAERAGKRCLYIPSGTNLAAQYCKERQIRLVTLHDGQAFVPQLSWIMQTGDSYGRSYWAYSGVQNAFNPAVVSQLRAGDTLVVQAREIPLLKK